MRLFVREGEGWPYCARPALGHSGDVSVAGVERVRERQRELGAPEAFEWVAETTPGLRAAVEKSGLAVRENPLMVLEAPEGGGALPAPPEGVTVRMVGVGDPVLPSAVSAPYATFGAEPSPEAVAQVAARLTATLTRTWHASTAASADRGDGLITEARPGLGGSAGG